MEGELSKKTNHPRCRHVWVKGREHLGETLYCAKCGASYAQTRPLIRAKVAKRD